MSHTIHVGCKLNLYLDITGVRENGYHELETLFYPVPEPHDTLELEVAGEGAPAPPRGTAVGDGLTLACSDEALETPSNLVAKAYEAYCSRTGFRPALAIRLTKRVPSGAGLGGGSADAAVLLAWLNARAGAKALPPAELSALAARLGADVPFFLMNRAAWATGIGDVLAPSDADLSGLFLLVCVPSVRVDTAWAYRAWDQARGSGASPGERPPLTSPCPASMRPFCVSGAFIANSFETVVFKAYPAVRLLKERLLGQGAATACMSGSGSAVFGLFRSAALADAAASALSGPDVAVFAALL